MRARSLQFFSLRTKLLLFAAVLVLVPGAIYGALTVSSSRAALARVVGRQLVEAARNAADRLATTLRSERGSLESFARQDVMREIRIGDLDKRISSFLASLERGCPQCIDLSVLDGNGRVVASSDPSLIGSAGATVFGGERAGGAIEGPFDAAAARPGLRFTVVIPDPDVPERAIGKLVALYDWERTTEVISRVRENLVSVGLDADVLILGADGVVIGGASRPDGPWRRGAAVGLGGFGRDLPEATGRIDVAAGVLFGHARLPDDLPSWGILVSQPLSEAFAPVRRTVRLLAAVLAATLLAALAVALAAARRVTRPLAELTDAAQEVGRGRRLASPVPVRSRDEVGTLAEAFNRMAVDLRRAERELVDAAKFAFVGELAAGVAHEVRTPLGVLRSSAQLLERSLDAKDEEMRELLQILRDEVDRIDRVVSGLLELGRPRELRPEPSPLGQIVFRAADFVEVQAREKGVRLTRSTVEPEPVALCDPELVYQVTLNLLVNAIQILSKGESVELSLLRPHDGYAGFEVRDDGPGIPAEIRNQIFEPFFTHREGGVGLGLTFVQRVVQEHRGRISVESVDGRGTVFRVELPASGGAA